MTGAAGHREDGSGDGAPEARHDPELLRRATGCVVCRHSAHPFCDLIVGEEERRIAFGSPAELAAFLREVRSAGIPIHRDRGLLPLVLLAGAVLAAGLWAILSR
ncbi:hypothetical protein [Labrys wisconsinensis]|uniref:Uncharacterized protein n=1 Tax=Labrys wisconsinensis TaxID=425677 RepID=A0ABU0J6D0_9HYPH|nr:hypothetical protein [Labrys wisconsinensis]MDQ0469805.1 hypothetical protein [Labrys wisconsinensis]